MGAYWAWIAPLITGNTFDPLNALFSGLAFWGVIYAILLQKSELALQRRELELTRAEVRGQKEQLEAQNLTLKQQRFENTFFSLLDFCGGIANSLELTVNSFASPLILKGRDCFFEYYKDFQKEYAIVRNTNKHLQLRELCDLSYSEFFRHRAVDVRYFFDTLENVVEFIFESEIERKHFYANIVRGQLSAPQMALLFYSCLSTSGSPHFKPLIERTGFFKGFPVEILIDQNQELY